MKKEYVFIAIGLILFVAWAFWLEIQEGCEYGDTVAESRAYNKAFDNCKNQDDCLRILDAHEQKKKLYQASLKKKGC